MSERLSVSKEEKAEEALSFDPFGCPIVPRKFRKIDLEYTHFIDTHTVNPLKEDPTRSTAAVMKKEKVSSIVEAAAKDVGIEPMLLRLKCGQITAAELQGGEFIDDTLTTGYIPGKVDQAEADLQANIKAAEQITGQSVTKDNYEALINEAVKKAIAEVQSKEVKE